MLQRFIENQSRMTNIPVHAITVWQLFGSQFKADRSIPAH